MEIEEHPDILDIVYTGIDGSGYTADPTIAALGAIEGEQVLGRFFSKKKGKKFFRIKEIIKTSPERVEPLAVLPMFAVAVAFSMPALTIKSN